MFSSQVSGIGVRIWFLPSNCPSARPPPGVDICSLETCTRRAVKGGARERNRQSEIIEETNRKTDRNKSRNCYKQARIYTPVRKNLQNLY